MANFPPLPDAHIESLAKVLGECGSGSDIQRILDQSGIWETSTESSKWRRLDEIFRRLQRQECSANSLLDFIRRLLAPARFAGKREVFEERRHELNEVLALVGLEYGADGQFHKVTAAATLDEAERRVRTIRAKFQGRRIHSEVLKYCRSELMQENYFHAVFEATKGLAERIRQLSGADGDGAMLVDKVFSLDNPLLVINTLRTEAERSAHKGFAQLLRGCFAAVRNPLAHEPKILWEGEDDTADWLSLISLLHRKLDDCIQVPVQAPGGTK